jgi:hypothetical protein
VLAAIATKITIARSIMLRACGWGGRTCVFADEASGVAGGDDRMSAPGESGRQAVGVEEAPERLLMVHRGIKA